MLNRKNAKILGHILLSPLYVTILTIVYFVYQEAPEALLFLLVLFSTALGIMLITDVEC